MPISRSVLLIGMGLDESEMYAEFLQANHLKTLQVGSTDAGLKCALKADAVVTDLRVFGSFNGFDLIRRLRSEPQTKETPIIVLTAAPFASERVRAFAAGCDVYLQKPCSPDRLLAELQKLLSSKSREIRRT